VVSARARRDVGVKRQLGLPPGSAHRGRAPVWHGARRGIVLLERLSDRLLSAPRDGVDKRLRDRARLARAAARAKGGDQRAGERAA
jgi:hypothetical protein